MDQKHGGGAMMVVIAVPGRYGKRLASALSPRHAVVAVRSWEALHDAVKRDLVDLCIVDPALEGAPDPSMVESIKRDAPEISIVLYTTLAPAVVPTLLRLGATGVDDAIVAGVDDQPQRIADLARRVGSSAWTELMMRELQQTFDHLPAAFVDVLRQALERPREIWSVTHLAHAVGVDRRSCSRHFARAGLRSPSSVLTLLRLLRGHRLLQNSHRSVTAVASRLGYARKRSFADHVHEHFATSPSQFRDLAQSMVLETIRSSLPSRTMENAS